MNADPADTGFPHLGLEDLIAEVTGQPAGDGAREHLASCERCRVEASRWNLVAGGVRGLAAAAPRGAQPARPRHAGLAALAGPRRRAMLAARAAAALVLLGGAGYGAAAALTGHAPGTGATTPRTRASAAVFTAVRGCHGLVQASGTLDRVNRGSLVIVAASGQPVTVTTTASTMVNVAAAPLSDIIDGASVTVSGRSSDGAIAAFGVTIGGPRGPAAHPGDVLVAQGTVADASTAGFTVLTSGGARVRVTISSDTVVHMVDASLVQLQAGATINAVGYLEPDATLSAIAVVQPPPGVHMTLKVVPGCSPASIDNAITTPLVSG
jgi:hypothetical protein